MPLQALQREDVRLINEFRSKGILRDIASDQLPKDGDIIICCADGDRATDLLGHHSRICEGGRCCHHVIALNGGPLLVPKHSPVAALNEGDVILHHVHVANRLKKLSTVHLYGHWPCGAAALSQLSIGDCMILLGDAKQRLLAKAQNIFEATPKIIPLMHIDYVHEDGRKRSYYVDRYEFARAYVPTKQAFWRREVALAS